MALAVEKVVLLDPIQMGLFRADGLMPFPENFPGLIQEIQPLPSPAVFKISDMVFI